MFEWLIPLLLVVVLADARFSVLTAIGLTLTARFPARLRRGDKA